MKYLLYLAPMLFLAAACQSSPGTPAATAQAAPANPEHIEASMLAITGLDCPVSS